MKEIIFPEDFILKGGDRSSHIKLKCTLFHTLKTDDDTVFFDSLRRSIVNKKMFCDIWTPEISDVYKRGKYLFFEVMCYIPRSSEDKIIHLDRVIQASPGIQGVDLAQGKFVQEFFTIIKSGMEIDDALARVSYLMEHPEELKPEAPPEKEVKKEKAPAAPKAVEKAKGKEKEKEKEKPKAEDKKKVKKKKKSKKEMKSEALLGQILTDLERREEEEASEDAVFCPKCEEEVEPEWVNCPSCGVRLKEPPEQAPPPPAAIDPVARARMDKALELANDEIDAEAKDGVDLQGAKLHMKEARDLFEKGDFDGSEASIRLAMAALDEARQVAEAKVKTADVPPSPEPAPEPSKEPQAQTSTPATSSSSPSRSTWLPPIPDLSMPELASPSPMLSLPSSSQGDGTKEPVKSFSLPKLPRFSWEREESPARAIEPSGTQGSGQGNELKLEVKTEDGPAKTPAPEPWAPEPSPPLVVEEIPVTPEPPKVQEEAERIDDKAPNLDMRDGSDKGKEENVDGKKSEEKKEETGGLSDLLARLKQFK